MFKQFQRLMLRVVDLVNSPRKTQRIMRDAVVSRVILRDFYEAQKWMDSKGFFAGGLSEASLRVSGGKFLITPVDVPIGLLKENEMLTATITGKENEAHPDLPRHIDWHRMIYQHTCANAVILCQPVYACLMTQKEELQDCGILSDLDAVLGKIQIVENDNMNLGEDSPDDSLLLVKGIGIVGWGQSLCSLLSRVEVLERMCELTIRIS